ncbi:MAG: zinc-dependent peptidase [Saprospiraceae bacterium]|nr:zinc-dependent peptidase [Saprospiraceae bacterium]
MLSRILAAPFVLMALLALYFAWEFNPTHAVYVAPAVIALAVIYVLSPQIDWWWYKRKPPKLDPMVETLLNRYDPFFKTLFPKEKKLYKDRISLFMIAHDYMPQGMESVPTDIKGLIAASAVRLTFGLEDYLLKKFEQIIVYPHPFPSPQFPEKFHASENFEEDGVIMFSIEQFMLGFMQTNQYYHLGLHEFFNVYRNSYPMVPYPTFSDDFWVKLPQVSGLKKEAIERFVGLPQDDVLPVGAVHFFTHAKRFKAVFPQQYEAFKAIFRLDPAEKEEVATFSMN